MKPVLFVAPIFQLILLGYAANLDVHHLPLLVCDRDHSTESRALIRDFIATDYFRLVAYVDEVQAIHEPLDRGEAALALVIPRGFGNDLLAGRPAPLQIIADGADANSAGIGLSYASQIVGRFSQQIALERRQPVRDGTGEIRLAPVQAETRIWYNPELKSRKFMVPGVLALLLMVITTILTSLAIVKEKETGTMEQLIVTPIRAYQLLLGKLIPFTLIGFIDVVLVLLVTTFWFGVPVKGSVPLLFGLTGVFLLTTLGLGLFVSTISRSQQQAMMTAFFFVMLPMVFLSGFVFPIENMPPLIQHLTYLIPLRYFFVIIRGLFLKGVGMAELWDETLALFILGIVILGLSALRFQKRLG